VVPLAAAVCLGLAAPSAGAATSLKSLQRSINALNKSVNKLKGRIDAQDTEINTLHRDIGFVNNQRLALVGCLQRSLLDDDNGYFFDSDQAGPALSEYAFATTIVLPGVATQNTPFTSGSGQVWMLGVKNTQDCLNGFLYHSPYSAAPASVQAAKAAALRARGD
jgi:hypothetical protein